MNLIDFCSMPVQYECVVAPMASPYGPPSGPGSSQLGSPPSPPPPPLPPPHPPMNAVVGPAHNTRSKRASLESSCMRLQCYICGKKFEHPLHLHNHMELHAPFAADGQGLVDAGGKIIPMPLLPAPPPPAPPPPPSRRSSSGKNSQQAPLHSCYICTKKFKQVGTRSALTHLSGHQELRFSCYSPQFIGFK
ncbi:hypothetical protein HPB48_006740 [Haemaphysalis longicornis]|uniref:C2H2-type domain-containing protein n=1 Tax=Haemaphysalis longicornis TaxID=44386 RepID=A0A9J6FW30_HAELO|nr:hypothetical protein HPB48_006740 [Haemaphysalis longicornis]